MKKIIVLLVLFAGTQVQAQDPITEVIKAGVKKVIKAVDLKIQRLQNETIALQNAQKLIENAMNELHLKDIGAWAEKQKTLYADYFEELQKVKTTIATYHKIKELIAAQKNLLQRYASGFALMKQEGCFQPQEIIYMQGVYEGIITESLTAVEKLTKVVSAFTVTMTDAERMRVIDDAATAINKCNADMQSFHARNRSIASQRMKAKQDIDQVKKIYGL
jgi:coenzyme F420-reducing hydrogenase delta subunit